MFWIYRSAELLLGLDRVEARSDFAGRGLAVSSLSLKVLSTETQAGPVLKREETHRQRGGPQATRQRAGRR
jgi:hypothetical protein